MNSLQTLLKQYHSSQDKVCGIRIGQYFCNKYIKGQWPELYYCEYESKSLGMIREWLIDNCYETFLPKELK